MRQADRENQHQSESQVGAGTHAVAVGVPGRTWQTGRQVSKHSQHVDLLPERFPRHTVSHTLQTTSET